MKSISAAIVVLAGAIMIASGNHDAQQMGSLPCIVGGVVWITTLFKPSRDRET